MDFAVRASRTSLDVHVREEVDFLYLLFTNNAGSSWTMKASQAVHALSVAAAKGYETVVRKLLEAGVNVKAHTGKRKETALHFAASYGHASVVAVLIENGADIESVDSRGRRALHCAAWQGHEPVVRLLLDRGALIDSKDDFGRTALHGAAGNGFSDVVQLLARRGADRCCRGGRQAETALERATKNGHEFIAHLLSQESP